MARKNYIERRRNRLYAIMEIPHDLRANIGRSRFVKSLQTSDLVVAERRAHALVSQWKSEIAKARHQLGLAIADPVEADAMFIGMPLKTQAKIRRLTKTLPTYLKSRT